jgi:hypothetical protein
MPWMVAAPPACQKISRMIASPLSGGAKYFARALYPALFHALNVGRLVLFV